MFIHLYTNAENANRMYHHQPAKAWLKEDKNKRDMHVSLDMKEWQMPVSDGERAFDLHPRPRRR